VPATKKIGENATSFRRWTLPVLLENGAGLQLILVGLVEAVGGREQRQRVEDARLDILGIALREPLHLAHIGARARAMVELVMIGVESRERLEVIAFARRRPP